MAVVKKIEKKSIKNRFDNFGTRFSYFREVWHELQKVHWPTRQQLLTYTGVVFVSVAIVAVLIWIVDSGLSYAMELVIGKSS